jgi:hypothetical protein
MPTRRKPSSSSRKAKQLALPFDEDDTLTCAFGEPWMGDHPLCRAEADRMERAFWEAVASGKYDEHGYTNAERRRADRRKGERR